MAIDGVRSTLPDPAYIAALERRLELLEQRLSLNTQQIQVVAKR